MKLYEIDLDYLQYLHEEGDKRVLCHNIHIHTRKFVAVGVLINGHNYYVPLSSPDKADYVYSEGIKKIRKTKAPTIMRLIEKDISGNEIMLGKLLFNNMIPVPDSCSKIYNVEAESDLRYKNLVEKQIQIIRTSMDEVNSRANKVYRLKMSGSNYPYIQNATVNFSVLEQKCSQWNQHN